MTTSPQADLILLIRLLHDDLSTAEGIAVRDKLADSLQFAERYRQMRSAVRQPASADNLFAGDGEPNVDNVAMFVDEMLNPAKQKEFEAACWMNPSLLHEVIATWRATHQPDTAINPRADFADRMLDVVRTAPHTIAITSQTKPPRRKPATATRPVRERPRRRAAPWMAVAWLLGALAVVVLMIVAPRFGHEDTVNDITDEETGSRRTKDTTIVENLPVADDGPLELILEEQPLVIADPPMTGDVDVVELDPGFPGDNPLPDTFARPSAVAIIGRWKDVTGVVAVRGSSRATWHGIDSDSATAALDDSVADEVLTFANSLASADLSNGSRLSLGPETLIRIPGPASSGNSNDSSTRELELKYGRLAVLGLADQRHMHIVAGGRVLEIQAEDSDAEFTIEQSLDRILCAIISGTVRINDQRASAGNWLELDADRVTSVAAGHRSVEWINGPDSRHSIPAPISERLNKADNLRRESRALLGSQNMLVSQLAARVLIELADVSEPDAIPETFIRVGLESKAEVRRVALVQWTLSSMERRPDRTESIWGAILRHSTGNNGRRTPPMTEAARDELRDIYVAAIQRVDPDVNWLRQLAHQLQPTGHVFARQSAKYFLERILNEDLSEYNVENPTRQSISAVTQKIRRWRNSGQ